MCAFHTLTVMTTDPQLRKTLREERTASTRNSSTTRTRDPTFAREYLNNQARVPYLRTSNTLSAPAAKTILAGTSRPTESSSNIKKQPHRDRPTAMPIPQLKVSTRGYIYGYDYGYDYYNQTMRKHKGCLTRFMVTAPSGTNHMTSSNCGCNQDLDPLAEGFELGSHAIDELFNEYRDTPENKRPMRPERPETPPDPVCDLS